MDLKRGTKDDGVQRENMTGRPVSERPLPNSLSVCTCYKKKYIMRERVEWFSTIGRLLL